jgi:hypothetical protein
VADKEAVADREPVADGAVGATDGVADGAVGPTGSVGATANDFDRAGDASCVAGRVDESAPTCALDDDTTDDPDDNPGNLDDPPAALGRAALEQPASIPNTARLTPADRRPRISLL